MKHRIKHNPLGRNTNQAKALYRGMVQSLISAGRIETTLAKAKAVVGDIDHAINLAKANDVNSRRLLIKIFGGDTILDAIFSRAAGMNNRNSGYTRIIRLENRNSDNAQMAILELVDLNAAVPEVKPAVVSNEVKEEKPVKKSKSLKSPKKPK